MTRAVGAPPVESGDFVLAGLQHDPAAQIEGCANPGEMFLQVVGPIVEVFHIRQELPLQTGEFRAYLGPSVILPDARVRVVEELADRGQSVLLQDQPDLAAHGLSPLWACVQPVKRACRTIVSMSLTTFSMISGTSRGAHSRKICVSAPTLGSGQHAHRF